MLCRHLLRILRKVPWAAGNDAHCYLPCDKGRHMNAGIASHVASQRVAANSLHGCYTTCSPARTLLHTNSASAS